MTNGGFPAVAGDFTDTGTGYAVPAYADGRFTDGTDRYPDDGDYPAGDEYLPYDEHSAGPDDRGYPDREGWYEDTGVHSGWAEGDDSGFLPGMGSGTQDETDARPGEGRTDGRGGRRGSTGPGKQSTGRDRIGAGPGAGNQGKSGTSGGGKRKAVPPVGAMARPQRGRAPPARGRRLLLRVPHLPPPTRLRLPGTAL